MANRSWQRVKERGQKANSEPASPRGDHLTANPPKEKVVYPDWMRDKSLLPKRPPGK